MSKERGVSGYTHTQKQLDDYAISTIQTIMHIGTIWTITPINVIPIMMRIGVVDSLMMTRKMMIKTKSTP